ncbi:fatty acyl-CoA reductase 2, chloroplastic-like [Salvia splendens]|uniref:fatty acyl-CoA reductase 2, chloroplastic-like n=1 Tax=Salvia splendens TaxID=180675 RepID=UPI001C263BDD|nr:fatty acyl-CoA reductase 2, chloroplastic-like [Salvia splendens]
MDAGIGILDFFAGKNIFVTGATGLLGKVIVEKILRSTSVGKVYLLIKAKDKEAAFNRLNCEIINSELFKCLKEKYGKSFEAFVKAKVIAVVGDICHPNLGMDFESIESIRKDVNIIIHSAACTTFNERYDVLFESNVIAPQRIMRFAKTCNNLQLFTHISTAYVTEREEAEEEEGVVFEKPLNMRGGLDVADEISLLLKSSPNNIDAPKFYKKLGQQRASLLGYSTTYQLCKAMGEMCLNEMRGDVSLLIIRPACIESCHSEPLPGWIQGMRMLDPAVISYGKGLMPVSYANPKVPLDIVPVDLVANLTIAAIAKHGNRHTTQPIVYYSTSSLDNPITFFDIFEYLYDYFKETPLIENLSISKTKFIEDFEEFSKCLREEIMRCNGGGEDRKIIRRCNAIAQYVEQLCKIYEFAGFLKPRYHTGNTRKLIQEMSREEKLNFEVDVKIINWKIYFHEIYIPGVIKYLTQ